MKKKILVFLNALLLSSCTTLPVNVVESNKYLGYKPIDPFPVTTVKYYSEGIIEDVYWESIDESEVRRKLLPLQSAQVSVSESNSSGKISYLDGSVSGEKGSYEVIMDYMKYRVENLFDTNGKFLGSGRIGVGLRIRAQVVTDSSNLNLGSIANIGLEASNGNLRGGISVDIIGIDSKDVTNLIPLTSEINQTSIQAALQALASIKSKLWDDINITPHLVAIKQAEAGTEDKIRGSVSSFGKDMNSVKLRAYWKPNGGIDNNNETALKVWMNSNGLDTGAGSITFFINSKEHAAFREKAVKELKVGEQ